MQTEMQTRNNRKVRKGVVVSDRMDKTITVMVERKIQHHLYKKYIKQSKKFYAHDEENSARIGDVVEIVETRPLSKNKCWRLETIVTRAIVDSVKLAEEVQ